MPLGRWIHISTFNTIRNVVRFIRGEKGQQLHRTFAVVCAQWHYNSLNAVHSAKTPNSLVVSEMLMPDKGTWLSRCSKLCCNQIFAIKYCLVSLAAIVHLRADLHSVYENECWRRPLSLEHVPAPQ